ncbi:hypothetical protein L486_03156 [Kwoniella mangroviensis CBS 10435]|uniref:SAP domain-containing protein n=1 Tax=Kwoniella mangroviensis CBS 10435 TaxID=1331196 RepID=A0A1B9IT12_9TREE|nr:hypothetical protein L486_03156 [Kwoniella mangroviensis CBS 10435]
MAQRLPDEYRKYGGTLASRIALKAQSRGLVGDTITQDVQQLEDTRHTKKLAPPTIKLHDEYIEWLKAFFEATEAGKGSTVVKLRSDYRISLAEWKAFAKWHIDLRTGGGDGPNGALSLISEKTRMSSTFSSYSALTGIDVPTTTRSELQGYLEKDLSAQFGLYNNMRPKKTAGVDDFKTFICGGYDTNFGWPSARMRTQWHFLLCTIAYGVLRPGEVIESSCYLNTKQALRYKDVNAFLYIDKNDQIKFGAVLRFNFLKGKRLKDHEYKELLIRETDNTRWAFDATIPFLALAFEDQVFEDCPNAQVMYNVNREDIRRNNNRFPLRIKKSIADLCILRQALPDDKRKVHPSKAWTWKSANDYLKKLAEHLGYTDMLVHCGVDAAAVKQASGHNEVSRVFLTSYKSRLTMVDVQNMLIGLPPDSSAIYDTQSLIRFINAPKLVSAAGLILVDQDPKLMQLRQEQLEARSTLLDEFQSLVEAERVSSPLWYKYLSKQIAVTTLRSSLVDKQLKKERDEFIEKFNQRALENAKVSLARSAKEIEATEQGQTIPEDTVTPSNSTEAQEDDSWNVFDCTFDDESVVDKGLDDTHSSSPDDEEGEGDDADADVDPDEVDGYVGEEEDDENDEDDEDDEGDEDDDAEEEDNDDDDGVEGRNEELMDLGGVGDSGSVSNNEESGDASSDTPILAPLYERAQRLRPQVKLEKNTLTLLETLFGQHLTTTRFEIIGMLNLIKPDQRSSCDIQYPNESPTQNGRCPVIGCDKNVLIYKRHVHSCVHHNLAQQYVDTFAQGKLDKCEFENCPRQHFNSGSAKAIHVYQAHVGQNKGVSRKTVRWQCKVLLPDGRICGEIIIGQTSAQNHIELEHDLLSFYKTKKGYPARLVSYCDTCKQWVIGLFNQREHYNQHISEVVEECSADRLSLAIRTDRRAKPTLCPFCLFDASKDCSERMQSFLTVEQFARHVNAHYIHNDDEVLHRCPYPTCPDVSLDTLQIADHLIEHHGLRLARALPGTGQHRTIQGQRELLVITANRQIPNKGIVGNRHNWAFKTLLQQSIEQLRAWCEIDGVSAEGSKSDLARRLCKSERPKINTHARKDRKNLSIGLLRKKPLEDLRKWCEEDGLPTDGTKMELAGRLCKRKPTEYSKTVHQSWSLDTFMQQAADDLKAWCQKYGLRCKANKKELSKRIYNHLHPDEADSDDDSRISEPDSDSDDYRPRKKAKTNKDRKGKGKA